MISSAFQRETGDSLICKVPALVTGILVHSVDATGKITLYDGQDANSGRLFGNVASSSGTPCIYPLHSPILFESGIYVTVTATLEDYTIFFIPVRGNSPLQAYPSLIVNEMLLENG